MKKQLLLIGCGLFFLATFSFCRWGHNTSISISDSYDEYGMTASYQKRKTNKVQRFLDECWEDNSNISFKRRRVDGMVILNDRTKFYLHSYPGELEIRIDKNENSPESCTMIKEICEDIKEILSEN